MYIHIGGDISLLKKNIVAIFDMDNTTVSKHTRDFLQYGEKDGDVITVSDELPRSFIVATEGKYKKQKIYISPISSATLLKRNDDMGIE